MLLRYTCQLREQILREQTSAFRGVSSQPRCVRRSQQLILQRKYLRHSRTKPGYDAPYDGSPATNQEIGGLFTRSEITYHQSRVQMAI